MIGLVQLQHRCAGGVCRVCQLPDPGAGVGIDQRIIGRRVRADDHGLPLRPERAGIGAGRVRRGGVAEDVKEGFVERGGLVRVGVEPGEVDQVAEALLRVQQLADLQQLFAVGGGELLLLGADGGGFAVKIIGEVDPAVVEREVLPLRRVNAVPAGLDLDRVLHDGEQDQRRRQKQDAADEHDLYVGTGLLRVEGQSLFQSRFLHWAALPC